MNRSLLLLASLFGFFGVLLGAFGAHGLKEILAPEQLAIYETAVRYQMYHALALLGTALLTEKLPNAALAGRLFGAGIVIFSGSLYALSLTGIRAFGMVTPLGGLAFLAGWLVLFMAAFKKQKEN